MKRYLLDQLPRLEKVSQIENLPDGQCTQTAYGGDAEEQHSSVGGSCKRQNIAQQARNHTDETAAAS